MVVPEVCRYPAPDGTVVVDGVVVVVVVDRGRVVVEEEDADVAAGFDEDVVSS
jgi:hypothetical protein